MLIELIQELNLELDYTFDGNYYFKNELMVVCLISPNENTDYEYILKANPIYRGNVWEKCEFEIVVKDIDEAISELDKYYLKLSEEI